ncbi:MAG: serine/threonine protein kinase [Myxococcaceae bacterium]|nr:MAG: serine/threonine protein kinase [Myxococcaceae bacterium]
MTHMGGDPKDDDPTEEDARGSPQEGERRDAPGEMVTAAMPQRPRNVGRWIDRYHLLHCVASGGMGEVHLALRRSDGEFRRWVAIKLMHPDVVGSRLYMEMFRVEARLVARLDDPHICAVHDYGVAGGTPYLAMEYLHGVSLAQLAQRAAAEGGVPPHVAARIAADAARGLAHAHAHVNDLGAPQPVVHRDVSPHNLLVLYTGLTKVVDFGIARPVDDSREFTRTGEARGKVAYMSPEQLRGDTPHPTMDLWALGVVLWEVTLGRRLFGQTGDTQTMTRVLLDPIPLPGSVQPGYPHALSAVIMRALQRDPTKRYGSAMEMARDLEAFVKSTGHDGHDSVAACLARYFAEEKTEREALLRELARDVADSPIDLVLRRRTPAHGHSDLPPPSRFDDLLERRVRPETAPDPAPVARRSPARRVVPLAVVGLALLGGGLLLGRAVPTATTPAPVAAPPREAPPPPVAAPTPPPSPVTAAVAEAPHGPRRPAGRGDHGSAREREPRAEPAATGGRLSLRSATAGTVFEGARRIGHTPLVGVPMSEGRHSLRLVPDDPEDEPQEVDVDIEPGAESTVSLRH